MQISPARTRLVFRVVAVSEAVTWAGLLIGMLFKYVIGDDERGVQFFGPLHGAMFLAYVAATLVAWRVMRWSPVVALVALICSIPPFASLLFEAWADRTGRLAGPAARGRTQTPERDTATV
jgi:integral membrane protein